ncbi:hypothetical protein JL193_11180 [Polaribacter batillariae]|uniref:TraX protein n=1 Tax=Polaribacter batillariae TaxID=2808900 RepID=A0ABX7SRD3_9FLAO|nr:TraX family protein [Polaribacter batillariae]QTD36701.1 hypothetical protein JL193_11180 [Polaribacter batillariae]
MEKKIWGSNNTNFLKIIGILTMIIDHIGKIFFYKNINYQVIGRITFPLFAYCLVVGFLNTKNFNKYLKRLIVLSFISQPFYIIAFNKDYFDLNIFFTLWLGLISLSYIREKKWLLLLFVYIISYAFVIDYGIYGILLINVIYLTRKRKKVALLTLSALFISLLFINYNHLLYDILRNEKIRFIPRNSSLNIFGIFVLPIIFLINKSFPKINKYFFYAFYPLHLLILFAINYLTID